MKICVFSDVHGNADALNKMIEEEKNRVDRFYFLGDIFGYFYGQISVIDTLMAMKNTYFIKGNHENNYLSGLKDNYLKDQFVTRYGLSYSITLSDKQLTFIERLPEFREEDISGLRIGFFHGGPNNKLEQRVYADTVIMDEELKGNYDYIFIGHTHYRFMRNVKLKTVVNPGSIGQPRDGKGFSYCIFDTEEQQIAFKNVEVNISKLLGNLKGIEHESKNYIYLSKKYG